MGVDRVYDVNDKRLKLRMITYLAPGVPFGLYSIYQQYLEEVLDCDAYLMADLRWSCPPTDRVDPFTANIADIGFLCSTGYLRFVEENHPYIELVQAAPVHIHQKSDLQPVYFGDIVIPKAKTETVKELKDLKGCRWAYNDEESLSGSVGMLAELARMGLNSSFFGEVVHSGGHHQSLEMLVEGTVDAASIDSTTFKMWQLERPDLKDKVHLLCSLGPLPIQPLVFNTRLSVELKNKITQALLNINKVPKWQEKIAKFHLWGFKPIDTAFYDKEKDIKALVKGFSSKDKYY